MIIAEYEQKFFQEWLKELKNEKNYSEYTKGMTLGEIRILEMILKISEVEKK